MLIYKAAFCKTIETSTLIFLAQMLQLIYQIFPTVDLPKQCSCQQTQLK